MHTTKTHTILGGLLAATLVVVLAAARRGRGEENRLP